MKVGLMEQSQSLLCKMKITERNHARFTQGSADEQPYPIPSCEVIATKSEKNHEHSARGSLASA